MTSAWFRLIMMSIPLFALCSLTAYQSSPTQSGHLNDPFSAGWILRDTNGDGIIDFIAGKVVVPAHPSAPDNASAADIGARLGFETTGFTPPVVISALEDRFDGPRIYVGAEAAPSKYSALIAERRNQLQPEEGGAFEIDGDLIVLGHDDAGLVAAAEAFASRAPYAWKPSAEKLVEIAKAVNGTARITGVTYLKGKAGIHRAFVQSVSEVTKAALEAVLNKLTNVHELVVMVVDGATASATSSKPLATIPAASSPAE